MRFDTDQLNPGQTYKLMTGTVVPRPIAWVVSADAAGVLNAAPFSFFNAFGGHPPVLGFSVGRPPGRGKDTLHNVLARGEFVVNLVPEALAAAMNTTAVDFPPEVDELALAGLATAACQHVALPRIAASPVAFECRLWQCIDIPPANTLVLGQVLAIHIDDAVVKDPQRCHIDSAALDLIGRMQSPGRYTRTHDGFMLRQLDHAGWLAHQQPQPQPQPQPPHAPAAAGAGAPDGSA